MDGRRILATLALLVVLGLAGCGQPTQTEVICAGCGDAPTAVTGVSAEDSVTHLYLDRNGNARVEARIGLTRTTPTGQPVDRTAERLRERLHDYVVDAGAYEGRGERIRSAFDRQNLTTRIDGDTFVVTYRVTNISEQRLGTTVVDGFFRVDGDTREYEGNYDEGFRVGTDRLVVHGPDGTRALHVPPEAENDNGTAVWTGSTVHHRTYAVFGTDGAIANPAIALETLSWAGWPLLPWVLGATLPLLGFAGVFAVYYPGRLTDDWHMRADPLFRAVTVLVSLEVTALILVVLLTSVGGILAAGLLAAGVVLAALALRIQNRVETPTIGFRSLFAEISRLNPDPAGLVDRTTVAAITSVLAVSATVTAVVAADYRATIARPVVVVGLLVLLASFPALGYFVKRQNRVSARAAVVTVVAGTPWLVLFAATVESGAQSAGGVLLALLIGGVGIPLCPLLFYAVLWLETR